MASTRLNASTLLKLTPYTLSRLTDRQLFSKEEKLISHPQPNIILRLLIGSTSKSLTIGEVVSYIQQDPLLQEELEISHSVDVAVRFYTNKLENAHFIEVE